MRTVPPKKNSMLGMFYWPSRYYHNRYECQFWSSHGLQIKTAIRDQWGDTDDMVWSSGEDYEDYEYSALITPEQLTYVLLRWG